MANTRRERKKRSISKKKTRSTLKSKRRVGGKKYGEGAVGIVYSYDKQNDEDNEHFLEFLNNTKQNQFYVYVAKKGNVKVVNETKTKSFFNNIEGKNDLAVKIFPNDKKLEEELIETRKVMDIYSDVMSDFVTINSIASDEKIYGVKIDKNSYGIISRAANPDVISTFTNHKENIINAEKVKQFISDIMESIVFLNYKKHYHNDIKLPNIVYCSSTDKYTLIDWGTLSKIENDEQAKLDRNHRGDPIFAHPLKIHLTTDPNVSNSESFGIKKNISKNIFGIEKKNYQVKTLEVETSKTYSRLNDAKKQKYVSAMNPLHTGKARSDYDVFGCNKSEIDCHKNKYYMILSDAIQKKYNILDTYFRNGGVTGTLYKNYDQYSFGVTLFMVYVHLISVEGIKDDEGILNELPLAINTLTKLGIIGDDESFYKNQPSGDPTTNSILKIIQNARNRIDKININGKYLIDFQKYLEDAKNKQLITNKIEPDECPICIEQLVDSDPITILTCGHKFHKDCIKKWCKTISKTCPNCRQKTCPNCRQKETCKNKEPKIKVPGSYDINITSNNNNQYVTVSLVEEKNKTLHSFFEYNSSKAVTYDDMVKNLESEIRVYKVYKYPDLSKDNYFEGDKFVYNYEPYTVTEESKRYLGYGEVLITTYATNTNQIKFQFDVTFAGGEIVVKKKKKKQI